MPVAVGQYAQKRDERDLLPAAAGDEHPAVVIVAATAAARRLDQHAAAERPAEVERKRIARGDIEGIAVRDGVGRDRPVRDLAQHLVGAIDHENVAVVDALVRRGVGNDVEPRRAVEFRRRRVPVLEARFSRRAGERGDDVRESRIRGVGHAGQQKHDSDEHARLHARLTCTQGVPRLRWSLAVIEREVLLRHV